MNVKNLAGLWRLILVPLVLSAVLTTASPKPAHAGVMCGIVVGGSGDSQQFAVPVNPGQDVSFNTSRAYEFIRSTDGPCVFEVFNKENNGGASVILGSGLRERIRAGIDGVENRSSGGGDTWRIRSVKMKFSTANCFIYMGGNGVRMVYGIGSYPVIPAMNRVAFVGGDPGCAARLHNSTWYNGRSNYLAAPFYPNGGVYDPGYRARSLEVWK